MEENQNLNMFTQGLSNDSSPELNKNDAVYDNVNGTLFSDKEGNVVWRPIEGNEKILYFDTEQDDPDTTNPVDTLQSIRYVPLGGFSFEDCLVIYTAHEISERVIVWVFQFNTDDKAFGQVLISDVLLPASVSFTQSISNKVKMRGVFENDTKYRVYWCDGVKEDSNPVRTLTFKINETTPTLTDPTYGGNTIVGTFKNFTRVSTDFPTDTNLMAPFDMGIIHFHKRINGSLLSGRYIYLYRLIREDGYRTPWSHHTNPVFVTTDPIDQFSEDNMHLYEMEASQLPSDKGHILRIYGIDQNYEQIETAYVYIPDASNVPTMAASFDFQDITGGIQDVSHISMAGETLDVDEMISLRLNITAAQSLDIHENHLWIENYKTERLVFTEQEIEDALANVTSYHIFRDMAIDRKGKTDNTQPNDGQQLPLFHVDTVIGTTRISLNDSQEMVYAVESDFPNYRGQQVDNTFVGYPRDELVRYGIVFWDKTGNPGFVYHLADFQFPKMFKGDNVADVAATRVRQDGTLANVLDATVFGVNGHKKAWLTTSEGDTESISNALNYGTAANILERPIIDGDNALTDELPYGNAGEGYMKESYARTMGIMFNGIDVSGIKDRISGFSIHRVKIEHTTIGQGLINPTNHEIDSGGPTAFIRPSIVPYTTITSVDSNHQPSNIYRPAIPHNRYIKHPGATYSPRENYDWFWDRNTCVMANSFGDHNVYRWNNRFVNMCNPSFLYDPGLIPSLQTGDMFELVQMCWEEFNYAAVRTNRRNETTSVPSGTYSVPDADTNPDWYWYGPQLCNSFYRPFDNGYPPYDVESKTTKLSWHLMVNTRHKNHFSGNSCPYNPEDGYPVAGASMIINDPVASRMSDFARHWNDCEKLFPMYGDFFVPEYIKNVEMGGVVPDADPSNPGHRFVNYIRYYINHKDNGSVGIGGGAGPDYPSGQTAAGVTYGNPKYDDFYCGRADAFMMDGWNDNNPSDPRREGVGHENTLLIKYDSTIFREDGSPAPAEYMFTPQLASWAESVLPAASRYSYVSMPNMGSVSRWIVNWKRPIAAPYGGQTTVALQGNIFVGTGHFQPIGNAAFEVDVAPAPVNDIYNQIEVFGGECWLDLQSVAIITPNNIHEATDETPAASPPTGTHRSQVNAGPIARKSHSDAGYVMIFPHEARWNLGLRNAPSPGGPNSASVGLRSKASYDGETNHGDGGLFYYGGEDLLADDPLRHYLEEFFINEVMGYQDRYRPFLFEPRSFNGVEHYPVRVQYNRSQKVYGDPVDVFREMLINDWDDLIGQYGPIYASAVYMDRLFILQAKAFSRLRIYEKAMLPSDEGAITLGDGSVLNGTDYKSEHTGAQSNHAVTTSPKGIYWVDVQQKTINYSDGEKVISLSDTKMVNTPLRELLWRYVQGDSIYGNFGIDIHVDYDPKKNKVHFNFPSLMKNMDGQIGPNESKRYKTFVYGTSVGSFNGLPHEIANITFVDYGDANPEAASPTENIIQVREQDIIRLHIPGPLLGEVAFNFKLLRGLYGSDLALPKAFTVLEFFVLIPLTVLEGWAAVFSNHQETSGDLSTLDKINPDPSTPSEYEGYVYSSIQYPHALSGEIKHDNYEAMFKLTRTHADAPFQVTLLATGKGSPLTAVGNIRSQLTFDEDAEAFENWKSKGHIFSVEHKKQLLASVENSLANGVFVQGLGSKGIPVYFDQEFISYIAVNTNEQFLTDKIWDTLMLRTRDLSDIKEIRLSTETHAIALMTNTETRAEHKRRYTRVPMRRKQQPDRVRGTYCRVEVSYKSQKAKTAYLVDIRTGYTISDLT